eukprot:Gb_06063 [translate_table: standard]
MDMENDDDDDDANAHQANLGSKEKANPRIKDQFSSSEFSNSRPLLGLSTARDLHQEAWAMAGISGGNLWSSAATAGLSPSMWSAMLLQSTEPLQASSCSTTPLTEMANLNSWSSDVSDVTPNSCCEDGDNVSSSIASAASDVPMAFANLGHQQLVDSGALLDSNGQMGVFGVLQNNHVWSQALLRGEGSGSMQNMQSYAENLHDVLYSRALREDESCHSHHTKILEGIPTDWELKNPTPFHGDQDTRFSNTGNHISSLPYDPQLVDDRLRSSNCSTLSDLGSSPLGQANDLTRSIPLSNTFNSGLDLPNMPQIDLGRIKQECHMPYGSPNTTGTLLQGFGHEPYNTEGLCHVMESVTSKSMLKSNIGACGYHIGGEEYPPGLWPGSSTSCHHRPAALSQVLPSSPCLPSTNNRNNPLWNFTASMQNRLQQTHTTSNLPYMQSQILEGNQVNSMTQHLIMSNLRAFDVLMKSHADEAPDLNTDLKKSSTESSAASDTLFKRPRLETPSALPTFKVRKEKLGDRITALQQLVSPFGKTDTASVLLEAIGYIKFLHEQVQVLSTPYMNGTGGNPAQGAQDQVWASDTKDSDEPKQDLRSRGLCLVPVSSTLNVANDNGADYWAPSLGCNFR